MIHFRLPKIFLRFLLGLWLSIIFNVSAEEAKLIQMETNLNDNRYENRLATTTDKVIGDVLGNFLCALFLPSPPSSGSIEVTHSANNHGIYSGNTNDYILPTVRLDFHVQNESHDVKAKDFQAQLGYKFLALNYRYTLYKEQIPPSKLRFISSHVLLRIPLSEDVNIKAGIGNTFLYGLQHSSGFSYYASLIFHPTHVVGGELQYTWSEIENNEIRDYDGALLIGYPKFAVKLGYRWIDTHIDSLYGPYMGLSLKF